MVTAKALLPGKLGNKVSLKKTQWNLASKMSDSWESLRCSKLNEMWAIPSKSFKFITCSFVTFACGMTVLVKMQSTGPLYVALLSPSLPQNPNPTSCVDLETGAPEHTSRRGSPGQLRHFCFFLKNLGAKWIARALLQGSLSYPGSVQYLITLPLSGLLPPIRLKTHKEKTRLKSCSTREISSQTLCVHCVHLFSLIHC